MAFDKKGFMNHTKFKAAERRAEVSKLYMKRYTMSEIADLLDINKSTVSRDIKHIEAKLVETQTSNMEIVRARELVDLDSMEKICIDRIERLNDSPTKGARWIEEWRLIKVRRAQLLGLDSAKKFQVSDNTDNISKERKDKMLDNIFSPTSVSDIADYRKERKNGTEED